LFNLLSQEFKQWTIYYYSSLFKEREDAYAIHWSKGSKGGYMPAKLYDPYINKVYKKGTNPSSSEPIKSFSWTKIV